MPKDLLDPFAMGLNTIRDVRLGVNKNLRDNFDLDRFPGERDFERAERSFISGLNQASPLTVLAEGELPELPSPERMGGPFEAARRMRNGEQLLPEPPRQLLPERQRLFPPMREAGDVPNPFAQLQEVFTAPLRQLGLMPEEEEPEPEPEPLPPEPKNDKNDKNDAAEARRSRRSRRKSRRSTREGRKRMVDVVRQVSEPDQPFAQRKEELEEEVSPY